METAALVIGRSYAFREKRSTDSPLLKIKLIDMVGRKGMVKIRFEDGPHPGLEEYVRTRQLVVPWGERRALLRDEERSTRLHEYARTVADKALATAVSAVLESTGEPGACATEMGGAVSEGELRRICDRAGIDAPPDDLHPFGFKDRFGQIHLPLDGMVRLAQTFAGAEPQTVNQYIDDQEEEYRLRGNVPGDRWWHVYLREHAPGFALARRWTGAEQEKEALRREIARLRSLASGAAYDLRAAGQDRKAARLLRAIDGL